MWAAVWLARVVWWISGLRSSAKERWPQRNKSPMRLQRWCQAQLLTVSGRCLMRGQQVGRKILLPSSIIAQKTGKRRKRRQGIKKVEGSLKNHDISQGGWVFISERLAALKNQFSICVIQHLKIAFHQMGQRPQSAKIIIFILASR